MSTGTGAITLSERVGSPPTSVVAVKWIMQSSLANSRFFSFPDMWPKKILADGTGRGRWRLQTGIWIRTRAQQAPGQPQPIAAAQGSQRSAHSPQPIGPWETHGIKHHLQGNPAHTAHGLRTATKRPTAQAPHRPRPATQRTQPAAYGPQPGGPGPKALFTG